MIIQKQLSDGRTYTYSDKGVWIRQLETGNEYESAVDSVSYTYEETEIPVESTDAEEVLSILTGGAS